MPENNAGNTPTLHWVGELDGHLVMIDQRRLPTELVELECRDVETLHEAIRTLRVRGAPAIGIAAAFGVCLGVQKMPAKPVTETAFFSRLQEVADHLASSRPTAFNLFWALERMTKVAKALRSKTKWSDHSYPKIQRALLDEARAIYEEDRQTCRAIGRHGAELLAAGQGVLTHCNAGSLATVDYGTALAVIFSAHESGKKIHAYVCETRPLLQGARLTTWELTQRGIDTTLICDSMAAQVMREQRVQAVITGADRIAANGDTANKIGTYALALLAAAHEIPFYIAAPISTFDLSLENGQQIPIEQRDAQEITHGFGLQTAPDGIHVYNPAFDVTPARLIKAIITERGLVEPVTRKRVQQMVESTDR